jgi:hypothetical protein
VIFHLAQPSAQGTGRMKTGKIPALKTPHPAGNQSERIAQGKHCRGTTAGGQAKGAGFFDAPEFQYHRRRSTQRAVRSARHAYDWWTNFPQRREYSHYFVRLAALREDQHDIIPVNTPQIPMDRFGGVQAVAPRAG